MTKRIPQPRSELSPGVRAHEAKLLSVMLRTSRLTWVFGEPGTDTGALLKTGVMPLLQRRRGDRGAAPSAAAVDAATPERRRRPARPRAELAILIDEWGPAPLSALKRRIVDSMPAAAAEGSLAQMLQRLRQQLGLHVVVLLDRFDEYLAMPAGEDEVGQFADELFDTIAQQEASASFLVAMDEAARPRLERFRARMPDFDHDVLRLSPVADQRERAPTEPPALTGKTTHISHPRRSPPRVPVKLEDVYAFIESTLARTSSQLKPTDGMSGDPTSASNPPRPPYR